MLDNYRFPTNPEDFCKAYCSAWVATAIVGSAVVGGAAKAYAANAAADAQKAGAANATAQQIEAAKNAIGVLDSYHNIAKGNFDIYRDVGKMGVDELNKRLTELTTGIPVSQEQLDLQKPLNVSQEQLDLQKPITLDQKTLETLPGYQFTRDQGLKATQNAAAARGLGVSGAALKGAATFATKTADTFGTNYFNQELQNRNTAFGRYSTTLGQQEQLRQDAASRYQQVWQNRMAGQQTAYDRLKGLIDTGANIAGTSALVDTKFGTDIGKTVTDAGKGAAANTIGAANAEAAGINAIGGAASDVANAFGGAAAYTGLYGKPANAPNLTFTKGIAGDAWVPTYGR